MDCKKTIWQKVSPVLPASKLPKPEFPTLTTTELAQWTVRLASYVDTLSVILRKLVNGLRQEIIRHEHLATSGSSVRVISSDNRGMALTVGQALSALLPSAPRDPALIMAVHAALIVTAQVGNWNRGFESSEVADHVKPMADQLDQVIDTLNERLTAHQPPLR